MRSTRTPRASACRCRTQPRSNARWHPAQRSNPRPSRPDAQLDQIAAALAGVTVSALESLVKIRAHAKQALGAQDLTRIKKELVERDSAGLVEFIESQRTLDDYHGQDALKRWLRQDIALWQAGDLKALPMGYLLCGPVGTGKTFLVECLAGEAGVPVVKLKNFRDRWVGSSEGNLEKIFRLVRALGRCMVFIDEADQTLGRRESGSGDSGLSGRLYSMIAQEMADTRQSRPRAVDSRLVAAGPDRSRSEAPRSRRRESTADADGDAGGKRRADRQRSRSAMDCRSSRRSRRGSKRRCRRC